MPFSSPFYRPPHGSRWWRCTAWLLLGMFCFGMGGQAQPARMGVSKLVRKTGGMARAHTTDSRGFLWLISINSVERFDGTNIREYFMDGDQQALQGIAADRNDVVWVTDRKRIFLLPPSSDKFEVYSDTSRPVGALLNLIRDEKGDIWLLCRNGLMLLDQRQRRFRVAAQWTTAIQGRSYFPLATKGAFLFFSNAVHVFRFGTTSLALDSVRIPEVRTIVPVGTDSVLAGNVQLTSYWVSFSNKFASPVRLPTGSNPASTTQLYASGGCELADGRYLLAIQHIGFFYFDRPTGSFSSVALFAGSNRLRSGLSLQNPYGVSVTPDGIVYATDALYFLRRQRPSFDFWPTTEDLVQLADSVSTEVRAIEEWPRGTFWLATLNGLLKWQPAAKSLKAFFAKPGSEEGLNFPSIRALAVAGSRLLVAQSQDGLRMLDAAGERLLPLRYSSNQWKEEVEDDFIAGMTTLADGTVAVAANKAAYLIHPSTREVQKISFTNGQPPVYNRTITQDHLKRIWWVGNRSISLTDSNFRILASIRDSSMKPVYFSAVLPISDSVAWLAGEGLFELRLQASGGFAWRRIYQQLQRQLFYQLSMDEFGFCWAAGDKGIYRLRLDGAGFVLFGDIDNAPIRQFHRSRVLRSQDGRLFFPSFNGVSFIKPAPMAAASEKLHPVITNVKLNNNDTCCWQQGLQLPYKAGTLEIVFVAPYFFGAENVNYRYKLSESEEKWQYVGANTSINLAQLPPGTYQFLLAASVNGTDWFEAKEPLSLKVSQPFWLRWWFVLSAMGLLVLALWFLIRLRERQTMQKQASAIEMERLRNATLQYDLEVAQVTHFFGTTISAQHTIEEMLWAVAKGCIAKLGFEDCVIYLVDSTGTKLVQKAAWGPKSQEGNLILNAIEIPVGKGIVGSVAASGQAELVANTSADSRYIQDDAMRLSELAVPVKVEGKVVGVIDSEHPQADFYTQRHLQILTTVAALCAERMAKIAAEAAARKKEMEVLELHKNLAVWQLASLRAQMNPHFLFNVMNSIQQFTLRHDFENANRYMTRFSKLLRKVLDSAVHEFVSLEEEIEHLQLYLEVEQLRMGADLSFQLQVQDELEPDAIRIPGMLVQPFVENALKHGLAGVSGPKEVKVRFESYTEQMIAVTIEDNGIGRERSAALQQRQQHFLPHQSRGMALVAERLELLNVGGQLPPYQIDDIRNEAGEVAGTRVQLYLPVLGFKHV